MRRARGFWVWAAVACVGLPACTPMPGVTGLPPAGIDLTRPGAAAPAAPPSGPAAGPVVRRDLNATVVFPAGSLPGLQGGLRIQRAVTAEELAPDALSNLVITINGQVLDRHNISFKLIEWGSAGDLRTTMRVTDVALDSGPMILSIATPSRNLELRAVIQAQSPDQVVVDVRSTAVSLIVEQLLQQGETVSPEEIDERAVTLVANRLASAIAAVGQLPLLEAAKVTTAVTAAATAQSSGTSPTAALNGGTGGGGGGGGSTTSTGGATTPTFGALSFQAANAPIGLPLVHEVVKDGTKLYASFNGLTRSSADGGQTWTTLTNSPYAYCLATDGTNLYGAANPGVWYAPLAGGAFTYLGQPNADGMPGFILPHAILAAAGKVWFYNSGDGKIYMRPQDQSLPWIQFGTGYPVGNYPSLASDGTHVFASSGGNVYALAIANAGGAWTQLNAGTAPTAAKELRVVGTKLFTVSGDSLYACEIAALNLSGALPAWTSETVVAGATLIQLDDDGTDLWVAGTVTPVARPEGRLYKKPIDNSSGWAQVGPTYRFPPQPEGKPGLLQVHNGDVLVGAQRLPPGGSWAVLQQEVASFPASGNLVTAGGYVWLREDSDVWRRTGAAGTWSKIETGLPAGAYNADHHTLFAAGDQVFVLPASMGKQLYSLDATQSSPSWSAFGDALPATPVRLAADATHLYAVGGADPAQVYRIPLTGGAWAAYGPAQTFSGWNTHALAADAGGVYLAVSNAVHKLSGGTWSQLGGNPGVTVNRLEATGTRLLCFGYPQDGASVVREWDGTAWQAFAGMPTYNYPRVTRAGGSLILAVGDWGTYDLPLADTTWTKLADLPLHFCDLVYEGVAKRFFATSSENGLYETP